MSEREWELLEQLGAHEPAQSPRKGVSSPPCLLAETDPAYHGFTPLATLVEQLNTLLEAERAGALVCARTLAQVEDEATRDLLQQLREDEIKSCRGLLRSLREVSGTPSQVIGAFYAKAMAIADIRERLQLLERGQNWVAKRIAEWLPGVANPVVIEQLKMMRDDHVQGIAALQRHLAGE
jgi:hypothetical protein